MSKLVIKRLRRFNHTAHKELWNWLAEHPDADKGDWPGWEKYGEVENLCFACETVKNPKERCEDCPLVWPLPPFGESICGSFCIVYGSLYDNWCRCRCGDRHFAAAVLARMIRDLPLRPDRPEDPFITEVI